MGDVRANSDGMSGATGDIRFLQIFAAVCSVKGQRGGQKQRFFSAVGQYISSEPLQVRPVLLDVVPHSLPFTNTKTDDLE